MFRKRTEVRDPSPYRAAQGLRPRAGGGWQARRRWKWLPGSRQEWRDRRARSPTYPPTLPAISALARFDNGEGEPRDDGDSTAAQSTGEGFKQYFEIRPALSEAEKKAAYRIRHSVYCEDLEWEGRRADGMETDGYDAQALHCLIRRTAPGELAGEFIGCVRLVRPAALGPLSLLPFERVCGDSLDRSILDPAKLPRAKHRRGFSAGDRGPIPPPRGRTERTRHGAGQ